MSELKYYKLFHRASTLASPNFLSVVEFGCNEEIYSKSEADEVIAEKDKEIAKLKADYSAEVEELCIEKTNVDTLEQAWKQSQRALWLMRAYFCGRSSEYFSGMASRCKIGQEDFYKEVSERAQRYLRACYKCQAMVKRYGEDK